MKITLNDSEINEAIALYVREKCIRNASYGWDIPSIQVAIGDEGATAVVQVEAVDPTTVAPMSVAGQMPMQQPPQVAY